MRSVKLILMSPRGLADVPLMRFSFKASPPDSEARVHRAVLSPLHGFEKRLVCRGVRSLGILATTPRHPLADGFEGYTGLSARGRQGGTTSQRDGDNTLRPGVQLRRPASRARAFRAGVQIRQNRPRIATQGDQGCHQGLAAAAVRKPTVSWIASP
jgi:hypothetical protein